MPQTADTPIQPIFTSKPIEEDKGVGSIFRPKFIVDNVWDYYSIFRGAGYFLETEYSEIRRWFGRKLGPEEALKAEKHEPKIFHHDNVKAYKYVNAIEAGVFAIIAGYHLIRDRQKYKDMFAEAVGDEFGKPLERVGLVDMHKSNNPFIKSAMSKLTRQYALRLAQPLSFLYGLKLGVISTVTEVTIERAVFMQKTSYDRLKEILNDAQHNLADTFDHDQLVSKLNGVMEQSRRENRVPLITQEELKAYHPLVSKVAEEIIAKRFGFAQTIRILGQMVAEPNHPEKAQALLDQAEARLPALTIVQEEAENPKVLNFTPKERAPAFSAIAENGPKKPAEHAERKEEEILTR